MFTLVFNLFLVILGFGLLIFVHELGHFVAAKWAGIRTEAFAVGMGPVIVAWRKGIGFAPGSTRGKVLLKAGEPPEKLSDEDLAKHGIGETEYSLRWLPIGGFVKMLGQEDANPEYTSDDPRSYNRCPVGKRMIVVSAGVVMNLILAAILFIIAFMVGVRFEAPVIGQVSSTLPAASAMPIDAEPLGIVEPGLQPGDRVLSINGREARTFADIQIASAMGRPDVPITFTVSRPGVDEPLQFRMTPQRDHRQGLLSIGVMPASSNQLIRRDPQGRMTENLRFAGLAQQGVMPGMILVEANGEPISSFEQFELVVRRSGGEPVRAIWREGDRRGQAYGEQIETTIPVRAAFDSLRYPRTDLDGLPNFEPGLLGLTPLVSIESVEPGTPNHGILMPGDAVLRFDSLYAPRQREFLKAVQAHRGGQVAMTVIRDGEETDITARVVQRGRTDVGMLNVGIGPAWSVPYTAAPLASVGVLDSDQGEWREVPTPMAPHGLLEGTRLDELDGHPIRDWTELRTALVNATHDAQRAGTGASVELTITHPTPGRDRESILVELTASDVARLHELGWQSDISPFLFDSVYVTRSADGNPFRAIVMGVEETHKILMLTYLTIDRLFRRTVGVDQLRGPVGIIHIGVTIADRGLMYLIFLLAMISVNLAVINFLPLPIVDGGLFLFLVYEKLKGHPPPVGFQNAVTILGLFLLGTIFVVVTYHDIARLLG